MSKDANDPYRVVYSERIRRELRQWAERPRELGLIDEYANALTTIHGHLTDDPADWGDPLYRLRQMNFLCYRGIYWGIRVEYGVEEPLRLVFVQDCKLVPGHPLSPQP
jgi:hypothetical protein